jgi:hypothetical protein
MVDRPEPDTNERQWRALHGSKRMPFRQDGKERASPLKSSTYQFHRYMLVPAGCFYDAPTPELAGSRSGSVAPVGHLQEFQRAT